MVIVNRDFIVWRLVESNGVLKESKVLQRRQYSLVICVKIVTDIASQTGEEHGLLPVIPQNFHRFNDHFRPA